MATAAAEHTKETAAPAQPGPVIVDLGKKRRKQVKQLRDGRGKLMDRVREVVDELRTDGTLAANAQPVLVIVRQRRRKKSSGSFPMGFMR